MSDYSLAVCAPVVCVVGLTAMAAVMGVVVLAATEAEAGGALNQCINDAMQKHAESHADLLGAHQEALAKQAAAPTMAAEQFNAAMQLAIANATSTLVYDIAACNATFD